MTKRGYKGCLLSKIISVFTIELVIAFLTKTSYQSYAENVKREQFEGLVNEIGGTKADVLMCCPTAWRLPLYYSEVNRKWQDVASFHKDPLPEDDWKFLGTS